MTKEELHKLILNQRVKMVYYDQFFNQKIIYGYVMKIYNGNYQISVWFDGEIKPKVVGYNQIEIV